MYFIVSFYIDEIGEINFIYIIFINTLIVISLCVSASLQLSRCICWRHFSIVIVLRVVVLILLLAAGLLLSTVIKKYVNKMSHQDHYQRHRHHHHHTTLQGIRFKGQK
jgi:uncharacterized protein (DUF983 family)